jgi:hypothetical protein
LFFVLGFVYYFFAPPLAFIVLGDNDHVERAVIWVVAQQYDKYYFIDGFVILFSWFFGSWLGKHLFSGTTSTRLDRVAAYKTSGWVLVAFLFLLTIVFFIDAYMGGASFFSGYQDYNILVLGPFATMAFTAIMFRSFFYDKYVKIGFIGVFLVSAIILLGLGSRMLVMMALIVAMVDYYHTHNLKTIKVIFLGLFFGVVAISMVAVGVVRDGGTINAESMIGVFFAEPLFTSISSVHYFALAGGRQAYAFPYDYFTGFLNFIPSIMFPGKVQLMEEWSSVTWGYNPFGASALLANLYINFGFFYPLFIISVALQFAFLYNRAHCSRLFRTIYLSSLPLLLLYIHREGFVTVVKVLYFNSFIFPIVIVYLLSLMGYIRYSRSS